MKGFPKNAGVCFIGDSITHDNEKNGDFIMIDSLTKDISNERDKRLLLRCYENILANVTPAEGLPWRPYRGIRPGRGRYFTGLWNWDTAFHAMCVSRWDPELAMESLRAFMQYQREDGMFADVIWDNGNYAHKDKRFK